MKNELTIWEEIVNFTFLNPLFCIWAVILMIPLGYIMLKIFRFSLQTTKNLAYIYMVIINLFFFGIFSEKKINLFSESAIQEDSVFKKERTRQRLLDSLKLENFKLENQLENNKVKK
jgi:hypothetical protein